ncbi:hypothetical protein D3C86_1754220 [compost metagenome]
MYCVRVRSPFAPSMCTRNTSTPLAVPTMSPVAASRVSTMLPPAVASSPESTGSVPIRVSWYWVRLLSRPSEPASTDRLNKLAPVIVE